mgnify:CR=1 FL=1
MGLVILFLTIGGILAVIAATCITSFLMDGDFKSLLICILSLIFSIICFTRLHLCPECGTIDVRWNNYCTKCGYDFQKDDLRYWECDCGNKLSVSINYCPDCGSPRETK